MSELLTARAKPAEQNEVKLGDIRVVFLPDGVARFNPAMFPTASRELWEQHKQWLDEEGLVMMTTGGFLIQTAGHNLLVDLGMGDKQADLPNLGPCTGGRLLQSLRQAGLTPEEIDTVAYTHLHLDHVGWTGRPGQAGLTFPNARHVMQSAEWNFWANGEGGGVDPSIAEVRDEFEKHLEFVEDGQTIAPGVNVMATPGHTPGHMSLIVSNGTERLIILGDVIHCAVQFTESDWNTIFDADPTLGNRTRERLLQELEDPNSLAADEHFSELSFGRLVRAEGKRQWSFLS